MQRYIGVKEINAKPMKRAAYNVARGWTLPADENGDDDGFLVEYIDGGKANTDAYTGYVSWSPKDVFERAYKPVNGMTFGLALEALKKGHKVARKGWNGKGMWLSLSGTDGMRHVHANNLWSKNIADYARTQPDSCAQVQPCVVMKTATGQIQMGWLASQSDMLAEDWELVA